MLKVLFISLFFIFGREAFVEQATDAKDCSNLTVSYQTKVQPDGTKLQIDASGGALPYKYIFYNESGDLLSQNFDSPAISGLSKGKLFCRVVDKANCKKTIEIEIN